MQKRLKQNGYPGTDATLVGAAILSFDILWMIANPPVNTTTSILLGLFLLLLRVIFTTWIILIALRQNRNPYGWSVFGFFLLPFALIIIGQLKQRKPNALGKPMEKGQRAGFENGTTPFSDEKSQQEELRELKRDLKPDEIIIMQKKDKILFKIPHRDWDKARAKGADRDYMVIHQNK